MTKRSPSEIYAAARTAGLSPPAAVISTAIALAESGGDDTNVGDQALEDATWGPSVGLWQVRTVKSQTGTGGDRDINALQGNVSRQALAMLHISSGGVNWGPWTTYTTGKYKQFLSTASLAGGQPEQAAQSTAPGGGTVAAPASLLPDINQKFSDAIGPVRNLLLKMTVVVLGLGLVGLGVARAVHPVQRTTGELKRETGNAKQAAGALL